MNMISSESVETVDNAKPKKSILKWLLPMLVLSVVIIFLSFLISSFLNQKDAEYAALNYIDGKYCSTWGDEVDSVEKNGRNNYTISYNVNQDYDLWKSTGTIKMSVYKDAGEWMVDVKEGNIDYHFEENDNWYYITASGNSEFLIKIIALSENEVTLEYYSYDMGNYGGPDDYEHDTTTCDLEYDVENLCFTFAFMGTWRIGGNYIEYNQFEVGAHYEYYQSSSGGFCKLKPANPDDYWWYERAKRPN